MVMKSQSLVPRRFQRNQGLRPIDSRKHVVDTQLALGIGAAVNVTLINTVDSPTLANTNQVSPGSTIHGVILKVECAATTSGALSNVYAIVYKNPGGNLAVIAPNTVGASDNKKFVIHQNMVMTERSTAGNPRILIQGYIPLNRYKRFGYNDTLLLRLLAPGTANDVCVQCIFKEYR